MSSLMIDFAALSPSRSFHQPALCLMSLRDFLLFASQALVCPGGMAESTALGSGMPCSADGCYHGTHVAGIAAGKGASFSGVARDASLISIQVFSQVNDPHRHVYMPGKTIVPAFCRERKIR